MQELSERHRLDADAVEKLGSVAHSLQHGAPSAIVGYDEILDRHIADSLAAMDVFEFCSVRRAVDIGTGAGVPGAVLAAAFAGIQFDLLDSNSRKTAFVKRMVDDVGLANATVVTARAEEWATGTGARRYDLALARAVAPPAVLLEYAAPLLRLGGTAILWRGARDPDQEQAASGAAEMLGMILDGVYPVQPFAEAKHRHLHVYAKRQGTPARFPRRPGQARKRPLPTRS